MTVTKTANKNGEKTRAQIIKAAQRLFSQKGFAGASISQIARKAKVTHSLIFHHFKTKEELWKAVKVALIDTLPSFQLEIDTSKGLNAFLSQIVRQRSEIYESNPNIARIVAWQALENEDHHLQGGTRFSPLIWIEAVEHLQRKGDIKANLNPELIVILIASTLSGIYFSKFPLFKDATKKEQYIQMIIDGLTRMLAP